MGLSAVLDTVIGLAFIYLLVSLFCSGINEAVAQRLGRRGKFLREGLINMVVDRWIYLRLINHPLVASLYRDVPGKPRTPSYVPSRTFADALVDVMIQRAQLLDPTLVPAAPRAGRTFASVRAAAATCKANGYTVGGTLLPLLDAARGDLDVAGKAIEAWFESGTQRVTGWYKAYTRWLLLVIGIAVAVLFNVDSLQIAATLSRSTALRTTLADAAAETVKTKLFNGVEITADAQSVAVANDRLRDFTEGLVKLGDAGLPIGFACLSPYIDGTAEGSPEAAKLGGVLSDCWTQTMSQSPGSWLVKIIGWLITGLAVSLGAPFWFDLLNKLVDLRGAGKKPEPPPSS